MPRLKLALSPSEPDPALLERLASLEIVCVAIVELIAVVVLAAWFVPALDHWLPQGWQLMKGETAVAALLSALSLQLSRPGHSKWMRRLSLLLAALITLLTALILIEYAPHFALDMDKLLPFNRVSPSLTPGRMAPQTAAGFALLGISILLIRERNRFLVPLADLLVFCLVLLVLVLVSGYIFGALRLLGLSATILTSPPTLLCLVLLTVAVLHRRAENGVFSVLLERGIGSRIARTLAPILLAIPFLREAARAHFIDTARMPPHYTTAILASVAAMLSFALVLALAWYIKSMETKIHDLSLRDELTGLYNLRGFHLLAEQSQRLAQRANLPFSVLYIDLDNLKEINDSLGHRAGSAFLAETGEILKANFRETDVLGRIGGDEFAVAGQFSTMGIASAAERLEAASALRNREAGRQLPLSFSVGYVTSGEKPDESLKDLLAGADEAMYRNKRDKKAEPDSG
jgi:diguanylate cyclase (GGDEF)-like protein